MYLPGVIDLYFVLGEKEIKHLRKYALMIEQLRSKGECTRKVVVKMTLGGDHQSAKKSTRHQLIGLRQP